MRTYVTTCHEADCPNKVTVDLQDENLRTAAQVLKYIEANDSDVPACPYHGSDGVRAAEEDYLE